MMKSFINRHKQLLAYVLLALAMIFTVNSVVRQGDSNERNAADNRLNIIKAGVNAVSVGCRFDFETNQSLRGVLIKSQKRTEKLYKDGAITFDQLKVYRAVNKEALEDIPVPDCDERVAKFIQNATGK